MHIIQRPYFTTPGWWNCQACFQIAAVRNDCQICPALGIQMCTVCRAGTSLLVSSPSCHGQKTCQLLQAALSKAALLLALSFAQRRKALVQIC